MKDYLINKRLKQLCGNGHLSNKDNIALFNEYKQDRLKGVEDSDARTLLILGNQRLVFFVLKSKFGLDVSDTSIEEVGVAQIGLVKSVDTFNVECGVNFATYACRVIINEVRMYYRKLNNKSNYGEQTKIFLEDYITDKRVDGAPICVGDTLSDDENFIEQVAEQDMFNIAVKNFKYLTKNEVFSIIHYLGLFGQERKSQAEIADMLNISRSYVSRHISRGLKKLKILTSNEENLTYEEKNMRYILLKRGVQNDINWSI